MHVAIQSLMMVSGGALTGGAISASVGWAVAGAVIGLGLHLVFGFVRDGGHLNSGD